MRPPRNRTVNNSNIILLTFFYRIPGKMNEYLIDEGLEDNEMREKVIAMIETSETYTPNGPIADSIGETNLINDDVVNGENSEINV